MNDRAELVAVVLAAEAIEVWLDAFPKGVEFVIDNLTVRDTCRDIACGSPVKSTLAHYPSRILTALASSHSIGCLDILGRRKK